MKNSNVINFKAQTANVKNLQLGLDTDPTMTKYEALVCLREYYRFIAKDQNKVEAVSKLMLENLEQGHDFPLIPHHYYTDYVELALPKQFLANELSDAYFDEYLETCL